MTSTPPYSVSGLIGWTERVGNRLPHPFWLFVLLTVLLAVLSAVAGAAGLAVRHPVTGGLEPVRNLLSREGLGWLLGSALANVAEFRPLSLVLVMLVGIGLAERTGFLECAIRRLLADVPGRLVAPAVVFAGILGNAASDVSYLILPPLGALVFSAAGRNPLAGFCAALAGTGAGYTANLFVTGTDVLTAAISAEAARVLDPQAMVSPLSNWYFMIVSVFLLTALGAALTSWWLEPRLQREPAAPREPAMDRLSPLQRGSLGRALLVAVAYAALVAGVTVPAGGWLHPAPGVAFVNSPFMHGIVPLLSLGFALMGLVYGVSAGVIRTASDVPRLIAEAVREMSGFFVVAVAIAQFLACFKWTNAGVYLAVQGAEGARSAGLTGLPLLLAFSLITAVLSLFVASSSSLWALLAPVFVPLGMLLGYHPAAPQLAFRIAESSTNIITPMTSYLIVLLPHLQRHRPGAGLGTLISLMLPYAALFFTGWLLLFAAWHALGWPLGPGVNLRPSLP
jgi:aminobenzoyl-glutamate transport protein